LPDWPRNLDCHTSDALKWFVGSGYFFVQAMKWPLATSYNAQSRASRLALQHALTSHLENEIEVMGPRHIVALGGAAWDACAELSGKHGRPLSERLGVDRDRLRHHTFRMATDQEVPLQVTRLPGRQNERFGWAKVVEIDIRDRMHARRFTVYLRLTT
jgi:uracil-DNA glycosylase